MTKLSTDRDLNKRQRIGWLVIILLVLSSLFISLWRYRLQPTQSSPIELKIHPIPADTSANQTDTTTAKDASTDKTETTGLDTGTSSKPIKRPKSKKNHTKQASNTPAPRDVTKEDL